MVHEARPLPEKPRVPPVDPLPHLEKCRIPVTAEDDVFQLTSRSTSGDAGNP